MSNEFIDPGASSVAQPLPSVHAPSPPGGTASLGDLEEKVSSDLAVKETIKTGADSVVERVKEVTAEQTSFAARQVGGVATALEKVGAELEGSEQAEVGRYAKQIGSSVQSFAKQMEGKDLGEIANMAEEFGRKQPLAFLGIAALAGLTASRFLTASATRTQHGRATSTTDAAPSGMTGRPLND